MTTKQYKTVRPDAKGRITLGRIAEGVSSYIITQDKNNRIILEPQVEIPADAYVALERLAKPGKYLTTKELEKKLGLED